MPEPRILPPMIDSPTHSGEVKPSFVMNETMITTITLPVGSFAAMTFSREDLAQAAIVIMNREEVEAHIILLRNAIDDAERADRGEAMIHASPSMRSN